jgi:iron complex outermembrane receptor protein
MARRIGLTVLATLVASGAGAAGDLESIEVTARKRVERLADIPQAVTVISAADIAARDLATSADLVHAVPNLTWQSILGLATPQIFLRGIGNATFNANQASPVGIYADGIYQGANVTYGFALLDLDRVEILKGPQGTLFGRNTSAGVVNFVSRRPDVAAGSNGFVRAGYGRFGQADVEAAAGFALGDHTAVRVAAVSLSRDGYAINRNPAASAPPAGRRDLWSARGQVRLQDLGSFDLLLAVHGGENHSDVPAGKQIGVLCPPGITAGQVGQCTDFFGFRDTTNRREHFANVPSRDRVDTWGASATATWHLDGFDLVSQTGFEGNRRKLLNDSDAGPVSEVKTSVVSRFHQIGEELRAVSQATAPFGWLVGANFYSDRLTAAQNFTLNAFGPGVLTRFFPVEEGIASSLAQTSRSAAVFGELNYAITDRLGATLGARWTWDRRGADTDAFIFNATGLGLVFVDPGTARGRKLVPTIPPLSLVRDWSKASGRAALSYRLDAETLAYVQVSHGFKGGDFNGGALFASAEATIADPEFVTMVEAGVKGSAFDRRLSYAAAAFHTDFTDQQVSVMVPGSNATLQSLANAAKTRVNGVELELTARPTPRLLLQANAGWQDAKFVRFRLDASNPRTNYDGNRTASSPKETLSLLARYEIPVGAHALALQADGSYTGAQFFTVDNTPSLRQGGYWLANASVGFALDRVTLAAWIKNIGDRGYYVSGLGNAGLGFLELIPGLPRTYGVTASARF